MRDSWPQPARRAPRHQRVQRVDGSLTISNRVRNAPSCARRALLACHPRRYADPRAHPRRERASGIRGCSCDAPSPPRSDGEGPGDRFQHLIPFTGDLPVPKSQHSPACRLEFKRAPSIVGERPVEAMLLAIEFDNRSRRDAGKVDDRPSNDDLAAEMRTFQFQRMAQRPPKATLRLGRRLSHRRGALAKLRINVVAHDLLPLCTPPPGPSPQSVEGRQVTAPSAPRRP